MKEKVIRQKWGILTIQVDRGKDGDELMISQTQGLAFGIKKGRVINPPNQFIQFTR